MDRLLNVTTALSLILILIVLISVRRAHIRVEYSVTWLLAAVAMLVLSRAKPLLDTVRNLTGLPDSPLTLFLLGAGVFLILFFRFSVIISCSSCVTITSPSRSASLSSNTTFKA